MKSSSSLVLVALLAAVGCAETNPGISIEGLARGSEDCLFTPGETFESGYLLDTSAVSLESANRGTIQLVAAIQIANRMLNRGNYVYPLMADTNTWIPTEAEVELRGIDGAPSAALGGLSPAFRVPVAGAAIPSATGTTEPGRNVAFVEVIPAVYGDALVGQTGTIVVAVRLTGTTTGGSTQQTGEFTFLVNLCDGCLRTCSVSNTGTDTTPLCTEVTNTGCLSIGQDAMFSACTEAEFNLACAAVTM